MIGLGLARVATRSVAGTLLRGTVGRAAVDGVQYARRFIRTTDQGLIDLEAFLVSLQETEAIAEQTTIIPEQTEAVSDQVKVVGEQTVAACVEATGNVKTFTLSPAAATFIPSDISSTETTLAPSETSSTTADLVLREISSTATTLASSKLSATAAAFTPSELSLTEATLAPSETSSTAADLILREISSTAATLASSELSATAATFTPSEISSTAATVALSGLSPTAAAFTPLAASTSHENGLAASIYAPTAQQNAVDHSPLSGSQQRSATPLGDKKVHSTLPTPLERQVSAAQHEGASTSHKKVLVASTNAFSAQIIAVDLAWGFLCDKKGHSNFHVPKRQISTAQYKGASTTSENGLAASIHAPGPQHITSRVSSLQQKSATPLSDNTDHSASRISEEQATAQAERASTFIENGLAASIHAPGAQHNTARVSSPQLFATSPGDKKGHSALHVSKRRLAQHEGASFSSEKQGLDASVYAPGAQQNAVKSRASSPQQLSTTPPGDKKSHSALHVSKRRVGRHKGASFLTRSGLAASIYAPCRQDELEVLPPRKTLVTVFSAWAPAPQPKADNSSSPQPKADNSSSPQSEAHNSSSPQPKADNSSSPQSEAHNSSSGSVTPEPHTTEHNSITPNTSRNMSPIPADVDDIEAFLAAMRRRDFSIDSTITNASTITTNSMTTTPVAAEEDHGEHGDTWKSEHGSAGVSISASADADHVDSASVANETNSIAETAKHEISTVSKNALSYATEAGALMGPPEQEEDRENLATFETWGTPAVRGKPAARVRTVIIKNLPSTWATPAKVLSLVHGGLIENVAVSTVGTAHVRFCDADACQAFYDMYPNGIDLDKSRKVTAFVEMGKDVNVLSSKLSFKLSVGATRVVRAIGVDSDVTRTQLIRLATAQNRKIEKIDDPYIPGEARCVTFRFCSIEDATQFRAALIRDPDWEQCNVQYGNDPCDLATGMHVD